MDRLQALDNEISGGSSANIALIVAGKLYVANVGKYHAQCGAK